MPEIPDSNGIIEEFFLYSSINYLNKKAPEDQRLFCFVGGPDETRTFQE
jgi:hypothetical protein